ncbi:MAG TPA: ABC transporter permease [Solirubrobacteraceae bacterium]|nr:ABC transporter permease [Solirubrobacteraceae bacterium]
MAFLWDELRQAIPLIASGNDYILQLTWVTIKVAVVSTTGALVIGLPIGLALGLGRFRGRRTLQILANATLALPPVLGGLFMLLLVLPQGALGSLHYAFTLNAVYLAQTLLALPYIVALTPAAIQGLPPGLLAQARALGAGRRQLSLLALREARIGVIAAVIAAFGTALAEVGAVVIVGGNIENYDQTLASAVLAQVNDFANYPYALAISIVLLGLILVLIGLLTVLQQRGGVQLRFRSV